jgi:hypothetical protein
VIDHLGVDFMAIACDKDYLELAARICAQHGGALRIPERRILSIEFSMEKRHGKKTWKEPVIAKIEEPLHEHLHGEVLWMILEWSAERAPGIADYALISQTRGNQTDWPPRINGFDVGAKIVYADADSG